VIEELLTEGLDFFVEGAALAFEAENIGAAFLPLCSLLLQLVIGIAGVPVPREPFVM
jgi:hypothetical protein